MLFQSNRVSSSSSWAELDSKCTWKYNITRVPSRPQLHNAVTMKVTALCRRTDLHQVCIEHTAAVPLRALMLHAWVQEILQAESGKFRSNILKKITSLFLLPSTAEINLLTFWYSLPNKQFPWTQTASSQAIGNKGKHLNRSLLYLCFKEDMRIVKRVLLWMADIEKELSNSFVVLKAILSQVS